jgi:alpha-1,2-mannosyltransferase
VSGWTKRHAAAVRRSLLLLLAAAFVAANLVNALYKGGDFAVFLEAGRRLIRAEPLYAGSRVAEGIVGPPFQALFFTPFAVLAGASPAVSRVAWYVFNLCALVAAVSWWGNALDHPTKLNPLEPWWRRLQRPEVLFALLAVSSPLHTNFQHQNLNVVLLAATGGAARALREGRDTAAGALVGFAAALKAFPALLLAYLALKRRWRALAWGVATTVGLTVLPILRYGPAGPVGMFGEWWRLSGSGGWPLRAQNQSLFAMLGRWFGPQGITATGALTVGESEPAYWAWLVSVAVLLVVSSVCLWPSKRRSAWLAEGAAVALGAAVLISPIAWDHYWVLFYPALYVCLVSSSRPMARLLLFSYWGAAALISGPALFSRYAWRVSRWLSAKTLAGVLIVLALSVALAYWKRRATESAERAV